MARALLWVPFAVVVACSDGGSPPPSIDAPAGLDAAALDAPGAIDAPATVDAPAVVDGATPDGVGPGQCVIGAEIMGPGAGRVVSTPAGINCQPDCRETVQCGTVFTLTALPTPPSTFAGWSNGCTGSGACTITATGPLTVVFARFQ